MTSRAPLRVRGEREYAVGPLALRGTDRGGRPPIWRARRRAALPGTVRDVQPELPPHPANASTVAAICRRLDALPLALELAAPWMKVLTTEDLLRRLERDVLLSTAGPGIFPSASRR